MKLATTTCDFDKYCPTMEERIRCVAEAGFKYIDLSLYNENTPASLFMQDNWLEHTLGLKKLGDELGIKYVQAHCPSTNPLQFDDGWEFSVEATIRSIEVCGILGIPNTVVHTGWTDGLNRDEHFEKNLLFIKKLIPVMEKYGVKLCIENSTRANMGERYFFYTGRDMLDFIEYVGHPLLKACWDTGHANIEGHQYDDITTLGSEHLTAVHINDNHGHSDEHIIPFMGSLCIDEVMHGLLDADYKGYFTFESGSALLFDNDWLCRRRTYKNDARLSNPALFMQKQLEKMMYDTGKYVLEAYGCFDE